MSYQASAWAAKQTTGSCSAKAVLQALAHYAGEHGECFPSNSTIAFETEQSKASVQRRMAELESKGLIARFERYKQSGGQTTMEIVLLHSDKARAYAAKRGWAPDVGAQARETMLDAVADDDGGVAACNPPGAPDGDARGSTAATGGVAVVQPLNEQSSEEPTEPPPTPQGGSGEGDAALAFWTNFEIAWGFEDPTDRRAPARKAFDTLTLTEAQAAIDAAPRYRAECRARQRKPCHARTWLAEKGWQGFEAGAQPAPPDGFTRLPGGGLIPTGKHWIASGTAEAAAWKRWSRETRGTGLWMHEQIGPDGRRALGCWKDTQWPPRKTETAPPAPPPDHLMEARS